MRIQLEILDYRDICHHRTIMAGRKKHQDCETILTHPIIVLISGKGVISKSSLNNESIIQRVKSNDSLCYSYDKERDIISFVQKAQFESDISLFTNVVHIKVVNEINDELINKTISEFYGEIFTIKNIIQYNDDSKKIISYLIKKFEIPFMITIFVILLVNFFVNSHFSENNSKLQMELINSKRITKNKESQIKNGQKLLSENSPNRSFATSVFLDKLSSQLPSSITLTYFSVDPVIRRIESQKPLKITRNLILLKGETVSANDITIMTNRIEELAFSKKVKIKNITQKKGSADLEFEVEIIY